CAVSKEQAARLVGLARSLCKEGNFAMALAAAGKAKELDPESREAEDVIKFLVSASGKPPSDTQSDKIQRKLADPIKLAYKDAPLRQVLSDLRTLSGLDIVANHRALKDAGASLETPVTLCVEGISLKAVLNILLDQAGLAYVIKDDVLQITSRQD